MSTQTLIVGGGLAGLALAHRLEAAGHDWQLFEARERWGGRVLTQHVEGQGFDLGPSWFWPGQPRIDALVKEFALERFDQAYQGQSLYQDERSLIHRHPGVASMQGSWRLVGGLSQLIDALVSNLPEHRLHLSTRITELAEHDTYIEVLTESGDQIQAQDVVLSVPPRIACELRFTPELSARFRQAAKSIPTWMAGHAKAIALYEKPFWKDAGLSGDAMSRVGPLAEIHDASPAEAGPYALFGFLGTAAFDRQGNEAALILAIKNQLGALFGDAALDPQQVLFVDWAQDEFTATQADQQPVYSHPAYGRPVALKDHWQGRLHLGSTEMGAQFGGFLEGALEVADELANLLLSRHSV